MAIIDTDGVLDYTDLSEPGEYYSGCYGFVNGTLYLGQVHHAAIIAGLISGDYGAPYDWEGLANAKQVWGWYELQDVNYDRYDYMMENKPRYVGEITFATDDAKQTYGLKAKLVAAFKEAFPGTTWQVQKDVFGYARGKGTSQEFYGDNARATYLDEDTLKSQQEDDDYYY